MKKLFLALLLLPTLVFGQSKGFVINGNIKGLADGEARLVHPQDQKMTIASGQAKEGVFTISGSVPEPGLYFLVLHGEQPIYVYLENSNMQVTGTKTGIKSLKIEGSAAHKDFDQFQKVFNPLFAEINVAASNLQQSGYPNKEAEMRRYDSLVKRIQSEVESFVAQKKSSYVSPFVILVTSQLTEDPSVLKNYFEMLDAPVRQSAMGRNLQQVIANASIGAVGSPSIDFAQNDTEGRPVSLASFKGKYVLVDFWASWCRPCRQENPNVVKAYNKFKDKNFTVLGVSLDQDKAAWVKAIEKDNLAWTQVSDLLGWNNAVAQLYRVQSIPQNFLIDPDGKIIAKDLRGEDLEKRLCEILGCN